MLLWIIVLVFLLIFVFRLLVPYKWVSFRDAALLKRIPGPKCYPFVGNIQELEIAKRGILPMLLSKAKEYGTVWRATLIGYSTVIITDPDDMEVVMGNKTHISKSMEYTMLHRWLGTGLLTSTGEKWAKHRKILTPAFHFRILENYIPIFTKHADVLIEKMEELIDEKYIEINQLVTLCTLDIICETAMGVAINAQNGDHKEYVNAVKGMCKIFHYRQLAPWLFHPWSYFVSSTRRKEVKLINTLHKLTKQVIQERKAQFSTKNSNNEDEDEQINKSKKPCSFLDTLLEVAEESGLSDTDIREEVDTFMFEGHDTTSAAISWALFLLGGHQDVQEKVVDELKEIFGDSDRDPDFEDLQKMNYLDQVIKETLRLYPSVPAFSRQLQVDLQLKDYVIPAGANVPVIPYVLHRNPDIFPDPEKFNPDHFLPERVQGRHPYAYLPFSAGPRNCIGQRFAFLEVKVVVSRVVRSFRLTSLDKQEDIRVLMHLILRPTEHLRIKIEPRSSTAVMKH